MSNKAAKRILLKLSGEALACGKDEIYDMNFVEEVAAALKKCVDDGYQTAVVVGAGNIWRGRQGADMQQTLADRMGMLATVINAICIKDAVERLGAKASVMTAVPMAPFSENYSSEAAVARLEKGEVVIFGAGLGIPFLSTDTAAAVRAAEIGADVILMAKNIDYLYTADPRKDPSAEKIINIKASEVLARNLKAIDATATAFCLANGMPIRIFGLKSPEDIIKAVKGECFGTTISAE